MLPPPPHRATTANLGAAYPFVATLAPPAAGPYIGRELYGPRFHYDPFELYGMGLLTNPNMIVLGQIGRGKSSLVKSYVWRQAVFGRRSWVLDPKGEYAALARALGTEPLLLRPGGPHRLNPLDPPPGTGGGQAVPGRRTSSAGSPSTGLPSTGSEQAEPSELRRLTLLYSLAEAGLGRSLAPAERAAIDVAVAEAARAAVPTLSAVVDQMLDPAAPAASAAKATRQRLAEEGREPALELRRLVKGDMRGMFDGPTSTSIDLQAPIVVLDLSAMRHSSALGVLMACAATWLQAMLEVDRERRTILVVDEAWATLSNLGVARWLRESWKLARAFGVSNVAIAHRASDLTKSTTAGSEQQALAEGLLADSETRVIYAQSVSELSGSAAVLGLTSAEADVVSRLGRGVALWKVGQLSFLVRHELGPTELAMVDTDAAMVPGPRRGRDGGAAGDRRVPASDQ